MLSRYDFIAILLFLYVIFCDFKGGVRSKISDLPLEQMVGQNVRAAENTK